mmetsp:Transcript_53815/g.114321  ORF Transcript_53815/g.114321 Transcript_53815/m.114321 type:complete len:208 (-) Transcript_53815:189-812(-)
MEIRRNHARMSRDHRELLLASKIFVVLEQRIDHNFVPHAKGEHGLQQGRHVPVPRGNVLVELHRHGSLVTGRHHVQNPRTVVHEAVHVPVNQEATDHGDRERPVEPVLVPERTGPVGEDRRADHGEIVPLAPLLEAFDEVQGPADRAHVAPDELRRRARRRRRRRPSSDFRRRASSAPFVATDHGHARSGRGQRLRGSETHPSRPAY